MMKRCRICREEFPASTDHFHRNVETKDGLDSRCKDCHNAYTRTWRDARREIHRAQAKAWRVANADKVRAQGRAAVRRWMERHPERAREVGRRSREKRRDKQAETQRRYRLANPQGHRQDEARRRARKNASTAYRISNAVAQSRWDYFGGLCWMCHGPADSWDHVKPLSKGGAHILCNMRPACRSCNSRKHATWPLAS